MDILNFYLGDKTRNDNTLIYDLLNIVNYYIKHNLQPDYKLVEKIVDVYLSLEVNIVDRLKFEKLSFSDLGVGYYLNKELTIDIKNIKKWVESDKKYLNKENLYIDNINVLYIYEILNTVFHELTHAKQDYLLEQNPDKYIIYEIDDELTEKEYENLYEYLLTERYANIRGTTLACSILSKLNISNNDKICLKYLELTEYLYLYEKSYPFLEFANALYEENETKLKISETKELDLIDRTHYGSFISDIEYDNLNDLLDLIIDHQIDPKEELKTLIKRIK